MSQPKLDKADNKEKKVEVICDFKIYANELESYLLNLYYLISWNSYPEEENTLESALVIEYLQRLVTTFHKKYQEKPIAISLPINLILPTARPIVKLRASNNKQKRVQPTKINNISKYTKRR